MHILYRYSTIHCVLANQKTPHNLDKDVIAQFDSYFSADLLIWIHPTVNMPSAIIRTTKRISKMKYWYQRPHGFVAEYVRTVLVLEGFTHSLSTDLPLVTNGMPAHFCCTQKDPLGGEPITRLTLFGKSIEEVVQASIYSSQ